MSKLKQALKHHGIEAAQVDVLFGAGTEAIYVLMTGGTSAVELWRRVRLVAGEIGFWPVILGGDEDLDRHNDSFHSTTDEARSATVAGIIAAGTKIDVTAWLTERAAGNLGHHPPTSGSWPEGDRATHHFTLPIDPDHGTPLPRVYVGLVPTVLGWQVPAYLRFGGWSRCPGPRYHVAMLKYWRQKYGAEVVGIGGRCLELAVSRPPGDRPAAMRLAREQSVYCPGLGRSSAGSLEGRSASLLNATAWSFWWE